MKVMMIMIFDDNYDDDNNDDDDNDYASEYTCDQRAFGGAAGASTSRPPQQESHVYNPGAYGTQWWYKWPYGTHRPPQQSHVHIIGLVWCTWYIWYSTPGIFRHNGTHGVHCYYRTHRRTSSSARVTGAQYGK